jgi:hypothetical protein
MVEPMDPLYPGPDRIPGGRNPGGVVVRAYDRAGVMLFEQNLTEDNVETLALGGQHIVDQAGITEVCLVAYDGDSGERMRADAWSHPPGVPYPPDGPEVAR